LLRFHIGWRFARLVQPKDGYYHCILDEDGDSKNRTWFIHTCIGEESLNRLFLDLKSFFQTQSKKSSGNIRDFCMLAACSIIGFEHPELVAS
jgi:hypothetical protein